MNFFKTSLTFPIRSESMRKFSCALNADSMSSEVHSSFCIWVYLSKFSIGFMMSTSSFSKSFVTDVSIPSSIFFEGGGRIAA